MTTPGEDDSSGTVPRVDLRLLGAPIVRSNGQTLGFRSRKVLALFVYLAVTGEAHTRGHLIGLLWPESDRERGRASLRSALRSLEQALPFDAPALRRDRDNLSIEPTLDLRIDLDVVRRAHDGAPDAIQKILETDFRGFLEGFSLADADPFDEWAASQRREHQRRIGQLFRRRCEVLLVDGTQADQLVQLASRWVASAETDEAAYRFLMRGHAMTGDMASAASAFHECERSLRDELGVDVLPETRLLHDTIQSLGTSESKGRTAAGEDELDAAVERRTPDPWLPLFGRRNDHLRLDSALRLARHGTTNVAVVSGVAGIGKSRLVEQFLDRVQLDDPNTTVLRGRTFEFGGQVSYQAPLGVFRDHLSTVNAPDDLLDDVWLSELSRLLPELRDRYPDLPVPANGEPEFERARWFEAVAQLGRSLAAERPLVIFLDDLHWADAGSFDLLQFLLLRWQQWRLPLTLIAAFRAEHLVAGQPLDSWLRRLERDLPLVRLELDSIDRDAIVEIVGWLDNGAASDHDKHRMAEWLEMSTGGHPLFVVELVRALLTQTDQLLPTLGSPHGTNLVELLETVDQRGRPPLPRTVRHTIEARLISLSGVAADVLLAAAVLGRPAQALELAAVAGHDESSAVDAIEELLRTQLLTESPHALAPYACSHDLVREVAHDGAGEARRRLWHRRAFEMIESSAGAPAARLAFHALVARIDAAAVSYSLAAGEAALAVFAGAVAVQHFDDAASLALADAALPEVDCSRLFEGRGAALELVGRYQDALDNYREMEGLAVAEGDGQMELRAIAARALIHSLPTRLHDPSLGRQLGLRVREMARLLDDRETEARALWCLVLADLHDPADKGQAWQNGLEGVAIADEIGHVSLRAYILNDLHKIAMIQGDTRGALTTIEQAIEHWHDVGNTPMLMDSYSNLSFLYCNVGRLDEALELTDMCVQHARDLDNGWHLMNAAPSSVWAHREFGNYGRAIEILEESLSRSEPFGEIYVINYSFSLALLHLDLGALDRVRELCEVADQPAVHEGYAGFVNLAAGFDALRTCADLAEGRPVATPDFGAVTRQVLDASFFYPSGPFHWLTAAQVGLAQGHTHAAIDLAGTVVATLERFGIKLLRSDAHLTLAIGYAHLGDLDRAVDAVTSAAAVGDAIGSRRSRWKVAAFTAELFERAGKEEDAAIQRRAAREALAEIMTRTPDHLRSGFEALGHVVGVELEEARGPDDRGL